MSKLAFYRVLSAVMVITIVLLVFSVDACENKINELETKNDQLQMTIEEDEILSSKLEGRIEELEEANEALIKVCNPLQFRKVAKGTKLPKLIG